MTTTLLFLTVILLGIAMWQNRRLRGARDRAVRRADLADQLAVVKVARSKKIRRQRDILAAELEDAHKTLALVVEENETLRDQASRSLPAAPVRTHDAEYLQAVADGAQP